MEWKLIDVKKETDHPFLNYFTLTYDVLKKDGHHKYNYYMASRKEKDSLRPVTNEYKNPDGVIIPTLYKNPDDNKLYFVFNCQFRPAINTRVYSVPAGLVDNNDSIEETAIREVQEEAGAHVIKTKILSKACPTSSGLSDEFNAVVLTLVDKFTKQNLEEFEEITTSLVPVEEARDFIDDHFFAFQAKFLILYIIELIEKGEEFFK